MEKELFAPKPPKRSEYKTKPVEVCLVRFGHQHHYDHFWLLADQEMYEEMDSRCHIIHIRGNLYFGHLVADLKLPRTKEAFKSVFPSAFNQVAKLIFDPLHELKTSAEEFIQDSIVHGSGSSAKWLSIHARGFYSSERDVNRTANCALKMLGSKAIDKVFIATDKLQLLEIVKRVIPEDKLVYEDKQLVNVTGRSDSMGIRNEMAMALKEWYILGQANYCSSTSYHSSSFSSSAIGRGSCKLLLFHSIKKCNGDPQEFEEKDQSQFDMGKGSHSKGSKAEKTLPLDKRRVWSTVVKSTVEIVPACVDVDNAVHRYWTGAL